MLVIVNDAFSGSVPGSDEPKPTSDVPRLATEDVDGAEPSKAFLILQLVLVFAFVGALMAALFMRLPYFVLEPGDTFETEEHVAVEGTDAFPNPDGEVRFVTVTQRRVTPVDYVLSKWSDSDELIHEDVLLGGRTIEEQREENAQLMLSSQNAAVAAALLQLGIEAFEPAGVVIIDVTDEGPLDGVLARNDVITSFDGKIVSTVEELFEILETVELDATVEIVAGRPGEEAAAVSIQTASSTRGFLGIIRAEGTEDVEGAVIDGVLPDGPVDGLLEEGDVIVSLAGQAVGSFEDLVESLNNQQSGDEVEVEALRSSSAGEEIISGQVVLASRMNERIGIQNASTQLRDRALPFDVSITTDEIGGPSAGLAFTLTVIDVLTDGDLTGGANIVVTGTIDVNGRVGAIGGAHQKAFAAKDDDAELFIVPSGNLEEARAAVPDLRIEPVDTLADALTLIAEFGGNAGEVTDRLAGGT